MINPVFQGKDGNPFFRRQAEKKDSLIPSAENDSFFASTGFLNLTMYPSNLGAAITEAEASVISVINFFINVFLE